MQLSSLFSKKDPSARPEITQVPGRPAEHPVKSAAQLQEDLTTAIDTVRQVSGRISDAERALAFAQEDCNLDAIKEAVGKLDALKRVHTTAIGRIASLQSQLADAKLAETIEADEDTLPHIIDAAEAAYAELEHHVMATAVAESTLLALLFNPGGLSREFAGQELQAKATAARLRLRQQASSLGDRGKAYIPSPRFEADSGQYLGPQKHFTRSV